MPAAWRSFGRFLKRPRLPDRAAGVGRAGLAAIVRLYPLDILIMVLLIAVFGVLTAFGFEFPEHALEQLEISPWLIALIVLGAPIGEELLFRGWLSGRPGHLAAFGIALGGTGLAYLASRYLPAPAGGYAAIALIALLVAGIGLSLWLGRRKPVWVWFQRRFGWFYYFSALLFAGVHLFNFAAAGAAMLPLTLPQFALGLILGYLRVNHGLWASMAFHALHNTLFIGLVVAAGQAA